MKLLFLTLFFLPLICSSQPVSKPEWNKTYIVYETAKIRTTDTKTKKYGPEQYKTSDIEIWTSEGSLPTFSIDIPDLYYIKKVSANSIEYKLGEDGVTTISYVCTVENKRFIHLSFSFEQYTEKPLFISLSVTDNISKGVSSLKSYMLTEVK